MFALSNLEDGKAPSWRAIGDAEEAQAFYSLGGELAVSRDHVDLRHLLGPTRGTTDRPG